jgi:hypothetical protein
MLCVATGESRLERNTGFHLAQTSGGQVETTEDKNSTFHASESWLLEQIIVDQLHDGQISFESVSAITQTPKSNAA